MITVQPINIVSCAADLLWSRGAAQLPEPQVRALRGRDRLDPVLPRARGLRLRAPSRRGRHQDFGEKLPSEVFREHIITCFIDDTVGVAEPPRVGIDTITWECDYPHSDTTWPRAPEILAESFDGVPDDEIDKITHENAMRHFRSTRSRTGPRRSAAPARCAPRRWASIFASRARAASPARRRRVASSAPRT